MSQPLAEDVPQNADWSMERSHLAQTFWRMRDHTLARSGMSPIGLWPPSGLGRNTMMMVHISPQCGLRSHSFSRSTSLSSTSSPTSSSRRGWKLSHPSPVCLGNLLATPLRSSRVMGSMVQPLVSHVKGCCLPSLSGLVQSGIQSASTFSKAGCPTRARSAVPASMMGAGSPWVFFITLCAMEPWRSKASSVNSSHFSLLALASLLVWVLTIASVMASSW